MAQTHATLPPLEKALAQTRDLLAVLLGRLPSDMRATKFELADFELPQELPLTLPSQLVEQRRDIRAAEAQLHSASAQIGVAIANMLPQLSLSASLGTISSGSLFQPGTGVWSLGGSLVQPLFEGGTLLHRKRATEAAFDEAAAQYRQTVLTAFQNVADTLRALQSDADALTAQLAAERAAADSLAVARRRFELGSGTHRVAQRVIDIAHARYTAEHIPGAKLIELPGVDRNYAVGDRGALVDQVEAFLTGTRQVHEPERVLATVLFTDIVGSTERAAALGDNPWRDLLEAFYARVREVLQQYRGHEINTSGDSLLAAFDGPARAIRCAGAIRDTVRPLGLEVRCGLHTGECEIIGKDLAGIAVHIGARVAGLAPPGEVLVSQTVRDLVAGSGLVFEEYGVHTLRGVPNKWTLFRAIPNELERV